MLTGSQELAQSWSWGRGRPNTAPLPNVGDTGPIMGGRCDRGFLGSGPRLPQISTGPWVTGDRGSASPLVTGGDNCPNVLPRGGSLALEKSTTGGQNTRCRRRRCKHFHPSRPDNPAPAAESKGIATARRATAGSRSVSGHRGGGVSLSQRSVTPALRLGTMSSVLLHRYNTL